MDRESFEEDDKKWSPVYKRPIVRRIAFAVACVYVAWAITYVLETMLYQHTPFLLFIAAALMAAWYGGFWLGLIALSGGFLLAYYFFVQPFHTPFLWATNGWTIALTFGFTGLLGLILVEAMHRAGRRTQIAVQRERIHAERAEHEVEERRRAEEALRDSEQLAHRHVAELEAIYESAPVGLCLIDTELRCVRINRLLADFLGRPASELTGVHLKEVLPKTIPKLDNICRKALDIGSGVQNFEFQVVHNADPESVRECLLSQNVIKHEGRVLGVNTVIVDITDRKRMESALRRSKANLAHAQRIAHLGSWEVELLNPENIFESKSHWSDEVFRIFGYNPGEIEASVEAFFRVLHPEDRPVVQNACVQAVRDRKPYITEYRILRPDGTQRTVWVQTELVLDESKQINCLAGVIQDITERKQTEKALQTAKEQINRYARDLEQRVAERTADLRESLQSLQGFLYHVAHDLRAPLRAMEGLITLLLQNYAAAFDDTGRNYAERIASSATRMDRLIQDLLEYGNMSQATIQCKNIPSEPPLDKALASLDEQILAKHAQIRVDRPLPRVYASPKVQERVFFALVDNALKFVAPGAEPCIHIWAETGKETVRFWVKDSGIGIDPSFQDRIFRVFERLHEEKDYPGTGIGLAIVSKAVERMKGCVGVQSKPGEGSRFWIELPSVPKPHWAARPNCL